MKPYPSYVCCDCAMDAGGKPRDVAISVHEDCCPVCNEVKYVSSPRDWRYPSFKGFERPAYYVRKGND